MDALSANYDVTLSMRQFIDDNPRLKYVFFGGKGGVGKTVIAGAAALWSARKGNRTLLASTNPVHSLSSLFGRGVFGKPAAVLNEERLHALEIDPRQSQERSKQEIREKIASFVKTTSITTKPEEFIESVLMNPALEESALYESMMDLVFKDEYDLYVFDTAPAAQARRLLGMSRVYSLWIERMLRNRKETKAMQQTLSFTKKSEKDPLTDYLLGVRDRTAKARNLLTDRALTAFFLVTVPESLPIATTARFITWLDEMGIPLGGVILNGLLQKACVTNQTSYFPHSRMAAQEERLAEMRRVFGDKVRAVAPLIQTEATGASLLESLSASLFA